MPKDYSEAAKKRLQKRKTRIFFTFIKITAFAALLGFLYFLSQRFEHIDLQPFLTFVKEAGPLAPVLFCLIFIIGPTILLPFTLLSMAAGILFGPLAGTIYVSLSSTIGAVIPFLITRKYGQGPLDKLVAKSDRFDSLLNKFQASVEKHGWKYVAFTRLVTIFPFLVLNYAFGLTKVKTWTYIWTTFVFMLPISFTYTYVGYAGRAALEGSEEIGKVVTLAIACLVFLSVLPLLAKYISKNKYASEDEG